MAYDLVIKNGVVIDGSGLPRYRADVGVRHGRIASIGRIREWRTRGHRRRGPGGGAGLHRRPHAHGRAGLLGSARDVLVLARRHQRGHGQLRLHAGALRRRRQAPGHAQPGARRGHLRRGHGGRHQVDVDDLPRVPRPPRRAAQGHQLRGLPRPLRAAHLRDGRARLRAGRDRGRPRARWSASCATAIARRRHGLHHLALAEPRDARPPPGGQPPGDAGTRCAGWWASWAS